MIPLFTLALPQLFGFKVRRHSENGGVEQWPWWGTLVAVLPIRWRIREFCVGLACCYNENSVGNQIECLGLLAVLYPGSRTLGPMTVVHLVHLYVDNTFRTDFMAP